MSEHIEKLKGLAKTKDFFVGIDSDGCVFDTMEIKHKECFIPNIINYWGLQSVSRFARAVTGSVVFASWPLPSLTCANTAKSAKCCSPAATR